MAPRWRRSFGLLLIAPGLIGAACQPAASSTSPSPTPAQAAWVGPEDSVLRAYLRQLWVPQTEASGGYGSVASLSAPGSLYATTWALELARETGAQFDVVDRPALGAWLGGILDDPTSPSTGGAPPLQAALWAATALADLGLPISASSVTRVLDRWQAGGRYRYRDDQDASWAATSTAVFLMARAQIPPPPALVKEVGDAVRRSQPVSDMQEVVDQVLPLWETADLVLPLAERSQGQAALVSDLRAVSAKLGSSPAASGEVLAVLADMLDVAAANSISLAPPSSVAWEGLRLPSGLVQAAPDAADPDFQATYYAIRLGMPVSPTVASSLARTAGPMGWRTDVGAVDEATTYFGLELAWAVGQHDSDAAIASMTRAWLDQAEVQSASGTDQLATQTTYFLFALAHELAIPVPDKVRKAIAALVANPAGLSTDQLLWLFRIARLGRLSVAGVLASSGPPAGVTATMKNAWDLWQLGQAAGRRDLTAQALSIATGLQSDGAYSADANSRRADLRSTAMAEVMGAPIHPDALAPFGSEGRIGMYPLDVQSSASDSPFTVYLALVVSGRAHDHDGVF